MSLLTFDDLYALRLSYSDIYDDEYIIINKLRDQLLLTEHNHDIVNDHLTNFYKQFDIDLPADTSSEIENNLTSSDPPPFIVHHISPQQVDNHEFTNMSYFYLPANEQNSFFNNYISNIVSQILPSSNIDNIYHQDNVLDILNIIMAQPSNLQQDVVTVLDEKEHTKITKCKLENDLDEDCTVCMGKLEKDETISTLPCKHNFHEECIDTYLKTYNYICPVCRTEVGKSKILE